MGSTNHLSAIVATSIVWLQVLSAIMSVAHTSVPTAACEIYSMCESDVVGCDEPVCQQTRDDVIPDLDLGSELNLTGHPAPYGDIAIYIKNHWNIQTVIDSPALAKHGIHLSDICPYQELRAGGVSRRSSLRFICEAGGFAYYLDDRTVVITTKYIARMKWIDQLEKPEPNDLFSASISQRRETAFAAGFWRLDPDAWIVPLTKALSDSDRQVCFDAAYALGELGPQAEHAVDRLARLLGSQDLTLREAAVFGLGRIGPKATDRLLEIVNNEESTIAIAATKSFNVMGSVGKQSVTRLIAATDQHADDEELCHSIAVAVANIDPVGAVPALCNLLSSRNAGIRAFAANGIAEIGPVAQKCAQEVLVLLSDDNVKVRIAAAHALARLDLPGDLSTAELENAAKDSDRHVRLWAEEALRVIRSKR